MYLDILRCRFRSPSCFGSKLARRDCGKFIVSSDNNVDGDTLTTNVATTGGTNGFKTWLSVRKMSTVETCTFLRR